MKTHVIQLDEHDNPISVRDKMSWTKSARILLVFPRRARILARTLDLLLLKRHAATLGAQLAVVTHSPETRARCAGLGIPCFATSAAAQRADWGELKVPRPPARRAPRRNLRAMRQSLPPVNPPAKSFAVRIFFFSLAVLAVLTLLLVFLPSAEIELSPQSQVQRLTLVVRASPDVAAVSIAGSVPARSATATVAGSRTLAVTGQMVVPDGFASGGVRFENLTDAAVVVPAGTVVRTAGSPTLRFATQEQAVLPAGIGRTVDVPARALQAGPGSNLPAASLTAIEGSLGASLSVVNPQAMSGGTETSAQVQTAEDRVALREALLGDLLADCRSTLQDGLSQGDLFFPQTVNVTEILDETYFPAEGQPGEMLALTVRLACAGWYVRSDDLHALALAALDASLPGGFAPLSDAVDISTPADFRMQEDGSLYWTMQAERPLAAEIEPAQAAFTVLGLGPAAAAQRLQESLPLTEPPRMALHPSWWPRLPALPFRIQVLVSAP